MGWLGGVLEEENAERTAMAELSAAAAEQSCTNGICTLQKKKLQHYNKFSNFYFFLTLFGFFFCLFKQRN